jgi:hypothetical protein
MFFAIAERAQVGELLGSPDGTRSGAEESTQPIRQMADVARMVIVHLRARTFVARYCRDCRNAAFAAWPSVFALCGWCGYRVDLDWRSIVGGGWA